MEPIAVLVHVPNIKLGLSWYQAAFPSATRKYIQGFDITVLDFKGFSLEIVKADSKVGHGKSGCVLYWRVESLVEALTHFESLNAKLYRGPIPIENNQSMCQVEDPFGNLIGLRGPL